MFNHYTHYTCRVHNACWFSIRIACNNNFNKLGHIHDKKDEYLMTLRPRSEKKPLAVYVFFSYYFFLELSANKVNLKYFISIQWLIDNQMKCNKCDIWVIIYAPINKFSPSFRCNKTSSTVDQRVDITYISIYTNWYKENHVMILFKSTKGVFILKFENYSIFTMK